MPLSVNMMQVRLFLDTFAAMKASQFAGKLSFGTKFREFSETLSLIFDIFPEFFISDVVK